MILNGLGFVSRALYLMPRFFQDKPVERLLGPGMKAEYFDDDVLGRGMDAIAAYTPGQQVVERGFRFLKAPWFTVSTVFLKSPKRIEALMMIMTLCLLVYSALEYRIRQALAAQQAIFPKQHGKPTAKPTARWVFPFFTVTHVLLLSTLQTLILNCNEHHQQLLELLGPRYVALYSDSG